MEGKTKMRALRFVEWGKLELQEIDVPKVSKNLVLVKVTKTLP